MAPSLPTELLLSITQQWPCRDLQILQLTSLLSPYTPSPPAIIVHGIEATGKSGIVHSILSHHSEQQQQQAKNDDDDRIPHAYIRCAECITGRHLLSKIISDTLVSLGLREDAVKETIDHVSGLAVILKDILEGRKGGRGSGVKKFVLVLDGVEEQREAQQFLLPALARLGEVIPSLCVVMILSSTPQPLAFEVVGTPHVYFPPYTRKEAISIVTSSPPAAAAAEGGISPETTSRLYPQFVSTVYDSLIGPTAGTIPSFRSVCARLWPQFIAPITRGEKPLPSGGEEVAEWDFSRLLVKNRRIFQHHGEGILVHHIAPPPPPPTITTTTSNLPLSLPYFPTLVLTSAYLATYTHPRLDTILFSKFATSASARRKYNHHHRKLKKISAQTDTSAPPLQNDNEDAANPPKKQGPGRPRKGQTKAKREIIGAGSGLSARPFPLERLLAIYRAIDPDPTLVPSKNNKKTTTVVNATADVVADVVYTELATLHRLRLVVPAAGSGGGGGGGRGDTLPGGSEAVDAGEKWRVNVSGEWVVGMAKRIRVDVQEFVGDVF